MCYGLTKGQRLMVLLSSDVDCLGVANLHVIA
jgi:hypothetical protein